MPEDDVAQIEVTNDDNKTSFLETALGLIKKGTAVVGGLWVGTIATKVALDITSNGTVDTAFLEQTSTTLLPIFTGLVMTLVGWFIREQAS